MTIIFLRAFLMVCIAGCFTSCGTTKKTVLTQPEVNISSLKYLGTHQIPYSLNFKNTTVGGLSGIDYDASAKKYYLICDDRSDINPARFYTANIFITPKGIDSVIFTEVYNLLQSNGEFYPKQQHHSNFAPDPEAMRFNPITKQLIWCDEGERVITKTDTILENTAIITISGKGNYMGSFLLPKNLEMQLIEKGPRRNGVLEGITFADNYTTLFVNLEEPLFEDGPRAENIDNNAYIRIFKFNMADRKNTQQYGYKLEPVAYPAIPLGAFKVNGASDILSIGKNRFLVTERSYSTGRLSSTVKVFIADLNGATDIKNVHSLKNNKDFVPATKKLLLNMDDLGIYIDNVEGVTFGPLLPNGHKTLIFVADNNFSPIQKSQLFLFEVME